MRLIICLSDMLNLFHGDVIAALLDFVFYVTQAVGSHIAQDLGENPFESVVAYCTTMLSGRADCLVAVVGDIECGAIAMAGLVRSVEVGTHESSHVFFGAEYATDEYLVERYVPDV